MNRPELVIAMYRPKPGKLAELEELVRQHFPTLKRYGLTTDRDPFVGVAQDGTILEIFEWVSQSAAKSAHDHPAVAKVWEAMAMVCEFGRLEQLVEAKDHFPHFQAWPG